MAFPTDWTVRFEIAMRYRAVDHWEGQVYEGWEYESVFTRDEHQYTHQQRMTLVVEGRLNLDHILVLAWCG